MVFLQETYTASEGPFDPLTNKLSFIENERKIKKFSLYRLKMSILTKIATSKGRDSAHKWGGAKIV